MEYKAQSWFTLLHCEAECTQYCSYHQTQHNPSTCSCVSLVFGQNIDVETAHPRLLQFLLSPILGRERVSPLLDVGQPGLEHSLLLLPPISLHLPQGKRHALAELLQEMSLHLLPADLQDCSGFFRSVSMGMGWLRNF